VRAFGLRAITGFSHLVIAESWKLKETTRTAIRKLKSRIGKTDTLMKWLELEHTACLNQLQFLVWVALIFTTGVLATWLTQPDTAGFLHDIKVSNAVLIFVWIVIGLYFGVIAPLGQRTYYLREQIKNLAFQAERKTT